MFHKMKMPKVKLTSYDLKAYGIHKPINIFVAIFLISALDYFTILGAIDKNLNNQSGWMNYVTTGAIVFVLDILTITISDRLFATKSLKQAIPWVTLTLVIATMICAIIYRIMSVDNIFAKDTSLSESAADIAKDIITKQQETATKETFHANKSQKFLNNMLSVLPIATSLFGMNISLKREQTMKKIYVIRNKKEIDLLSTQIFELSEYISFDDNADNLEKKQAMESICKSIVTTMEAEKNNALAKKLNDPQSITYIAKNSRLIDFDEIKHPQNGNEHKNQITKNENDEMNEESI